MDLRWDPHTCAACGGKFEVGYEDGAEGGFTLVEAPCPRCGKPKSLSLPESAASRLLVEPVEDDEPVEEGVGD